MDKIVNNKRNLFGNFYTLSKFHLIVKTTHEDYRPIVTDLFPNRRTIANRNKVTYLILNITKKIIVNQ